MRSLTECGLLASLAVDLLEQADRRLDDAAGRALAHAEAEVRNRYLAAIGADWRAVEAVTEAHGRLTVRVAVGDAGAVSGGSRS